MDNEQRLTSLSLTYQFSPNLPQTETEIVSPEYGPVMSAKVVLILQNSQCPC